MVFGLVLAAPHMHAFVLSLDHFLFFASGYGIGKIRFELQRRRDRAIARGNPVARQSLLRLARPSPRFRESYLEALREWRGEQMQWHLDVDVRALESDFASFVRAESSFAHRAPPTKVRETVYWGVVDDVVVGRIASGMSSTTSCG